MTMPGLARSAFLSRTINRFNFQHGPTLFLFDELEEDVYGFRG
jgi:hypothetical protein